MIKIANNLQKLAGRQSPIGAEDITSSVSGAFPIVGGITGATGGGILGGGIGALLEYLNAEKKKKDYLKAVLMGGGIGAGAGGLLGGGAGYLASSSMNNIAKKIDQL